jgi:hypothetical protein
MDTLARVFGLVGVAALAVTSWIAIAWTFAPFVVEAASALHQTYGY